VGRDVTEKALLLAIGIDHRVDLCREVVGSGATPTAKERAEAAALKLAVFDAAARAIEAGLPKSSVLVWADPDLGEGVLLRARAMALPVAVSVEKPGKAESGLSLEETAEAWEMITRLKVTFAAARLGYNFAGPRAERENAKEGLKALSSKCRETGHKLVIELAPHPTAQQLEASGGTVTTSLHARLLIEGMKDLQDTGVEPAVWVVSPPLDELTAATVVAQAHVDGRAGVTVLFETGTDPDPGRITAGPSRADRAVARLAARTPGTGGLLAGPDTYFSALARLHQGLIEREAAIEIIASHLRKLWDVFSEARRTSRVV
jgi:myo-inositol catabolism protein IolC